MQYRILIRTFCQSYLGASTTIKSATFPISIEPWVFDLPSEAAAFIVAAANASFIDIRRITQARCIVRGYKMEKAISRKRKVRAKHTISHIAMYKKTASNQ